MRFGLNERKRPELFKGRHFEAEIIVLWALHNLALGPAVGA